MEFRELINDYIEASSEFVDEFEAILMQLEAAEGQVPDLDLINQITGGLHTLKGNSGMMGVSAVESYVHRLEDLFSGVRAGTLAFDDVTLEFCLQCTRVLREAIGGLAAEPPVEPHLDREIENVARFILDKGASLRRVAARSGATADERAESAAPQGAEERAPESVDGSSTAAGVMQKTNVLKVDFQRLDNLLNLMGELVIWRTRLGRVGAQLREAFGEKGVVMDVSATAEQIGKVTTELHEAIMKVRMLPIRQVFMRFPRPIRDLARERGKEVNLRFEGEETELDKTVIDEIGEPLMHLLRNAVDHGVEQPSPRSAQGKPRQGTILVRTYQESNNIIITVEDDGQGINEEALRDKARLLGKTGLTRQELLELIFLPGLSTAETVTEVSGRGMGMDIVIKSLAKINGTIQVESTPGVGTRFTIKLPLTLAIISALMVETSGEQYAIPLATVLESIKLNRSEVHLVNHREVIRVRERILPLLRLSRSFGVEGLEKSDQPYVVVVQSGGLEMGMIVDNLLGQQEIVIKALDDYVGHSMGVAGATILGDGKVVLIVDVPALMEAGRSQEVFEEETPTAPREEASPEATEVLNA